MKKLKKITKKQHNEIIDLFGKGALAVHICKHLGLSRSDAAEKRDYNSENRDDLFIKAMEIGDIHSMVYWFDRGEEEGIKTRVWELKMKNIFGWSSNAPNVPYRGNLPESNIIYNKNNPQEAANELIQQCIAGNISNDKAKVIMELITQSYAFKRIEEFKEEIVPLEIKEIKDK